MGTGVTVWAAARRERKSFERAQSEHHLDRVRDVYDYALNVIFNMERGGNPDRASLGTAFARVSLHGSADVDRIIRDYVLLSPQERKIDLPSLVSAMKKHLSQLEGRSP